MGKNGPSTKNSRTIGILLLLCAKTLVFRRSSLFADELQGTPINHNNFREFESHYQQCSFEELSSESSSHFALVLEICWFNISHCWRKKSCPSWYGKYRSFHRVLYIPGGAGFLPSTVGTPSYIESGILSWDLPTATAMFYQWVRKTYWCNSTIQPYNDIII